MPRNFYTFWAIRITPIVCFNEAAADAAEFLSVAGVRMTNATGSFNEAAADAAEFFLNEAGKDALPTLLQ